MVPSIGLGTLAGLIAWRSNQSAPVPIKAIFSIGGVFMSTLITHEKIRNTLKSKVSEVLPEKFVNTYQIVDRRIGSLGADLWNQSEDLVHYTKTKIITIYSNIKK